MADVSAKNALSNVTNDIKSRPVLDAFGPDMSGSQFLDVMMARLTALGSTEEDLKVVAKETAENGQVRDANILSQMRGLKKKPEVKDAKAPVSAEQAAKVDVKEKIKAKIKDIQSRDETDVSNDKSLKSLKKVAEFLIKAENDGKIDLPPELTQKLNEFIAKGDNLKAADVASFLREFSDAFKTMIVAIAAAPEGEDALKWPKELSAELKDVGLGAFIAEDKPLTVYDVARLVKALANQGEKVAVEALNAKSKDALIPQDRAEILVNAAAANVSKEAKAPEAVILPEAVKAPEPTKPQRVETSALPVVPAAPVSADMAAQAPKALKASKEAAVPSDAPELPDAAASLLGDKGEQAKVEKTPLDKKAADPSNVGQQPSQGKEAAPSSSSATLVQAMVAASKPAPVAAASFDVASGVTNVSPLNGATSLNAAVDGLNKTIQQTAHGRFAAALQQAESSPATQQVAVQLQQRAGKSGNISLQLTPAELGRVDVRISIQRDGTAHAVIAADKPETLAMLQKDASQLEKALQQAGLNANQENMSFNLREQRQSQQFDQGRKRFSRDSLEDGIKEVSLNLPLTEAVFSDDRVNYHA